MGISRHTALDTDEAACYYCIRDGLKRIAVDRRRGGVWVFFSLACWIPRCQLRVSCVARASGLFVGVRKSRVLQSECVCVCVCVGGGGDGRGCVRVCVCVCACVCVMFPVIGSYWQFVCQLLTKCAKRHPVGHSLNCS